MKPDPLLKEALQRYFSTVSILKKGREQERYRIDQISRSPIGDMLVQEISSVNIATYRDARLTSINPRTGKPIGPATVRLELALLSNFFDIARIEWGICEANPVTNVRKPKPPPGRDRRLTAREERMILRYAHGHVNPDLYSIVVIALETAMRQGEILKLQWEHINLKTRIAHLPETKNGSKRDVPLSIRARDAFIRMGAKSKGPVFGYTAHGLKSTWQFMLKKLAIEDLHFHDLRHEAISRLFELGTLDIMEVSAISGHKSLSMLKRYTHLKAARLVRKLEGVRHKGRQAVLDHLVPYPAQVLESNEGCRVEILDFDGLIVLGQDRPSAIADAQTTLLRRILCDMKNAVAIPSPDQYLQEVDSRRLIMIDPLTV